MAEHLVEQLRATVEKLENRLKTLEDRLHHGDNETAPARGGAGDGMRMILIGPPGAGTFLNGCCESTTSRLGGLWKSTDAISMSQARARRRRRSRSGMGAVIWLPATCCARKSRRRRNWAGRRRRLWMKESWCRTISW